MSTLQLLNPEEFGIDLKKATGIEASFLPKKVETEGFMKVYENIINKEINKETCKEARELRLQLVKVRTGISDIHKAEKEFFLLSGRYVDALKNKLTEPVKQMEEKLLDIEKYFENEEKKRKEELRAYRESQLEPYGTDTTFISLDLMSDDQFLDLLSKEQLSFETRKREEEERERQAVETARLDKLEVDRKLLVSSFSQFINPSFDYRNSSDKDFEKEVSSAKEKQDAHNKEIEEQRIELERIKAEQEAKEKKEKEEREAKEKIQKERFNKLSPFNKNAGTMNLHDMSDKDFKSLLEASKKEHIEFQKMLAQQEKYRIEKAKQEEHQRKLKLAPDVDKLRNLYSSLKSLDIPEVSSDDAKKAIERFKSGIDNVLKTLADDAKKLK